VIKTTATSAGAGSTQRFSRWMAAALVSLLGVSTLAVDQVSAAGFSGSAAGVPLTDGSLYNVVDQVGARSLWAKGFTGRGVNVAVIDTGVADVPALSGPDKVVAMVDLSGESGDPATRFLDTYGHGTHIAGIIAGRDPGANPALAATHPEWFLGVAPNAGIVSVKVAGRNGAVDVSQVIAGIDWVVQHAARLNIRVLNLSYGTDTTQPYTIDPLAYAVERAWKAGIVVVAAVGNDGRAARQLSMPARDPYVIAVSAAERKNGQWKVPDWASSGDSERSPDLSAPGASIVSLRNPGSFADVEHPTGFVSQALFKGSGSSQAAAVVSGAAALILSARPALTPDQVKGLLTTAADSKAITARAVKFSGSGLLDVAKAAVTATPQVTQSWPLSTGLGSLEASRGSAHVLLNGTVLQGEVTILGTPWVGVSWAGADWAGGSWNGVSWAGVSWAGVSWASASWTGVSWAGVSWAGVSWASASWTGVSWAGVSWAGVSWAGVSWAGVSWPVAAWS
jgi:serine protease AprX